MLEEFCYDIEKFLDKLKSSLKLDNVSVNEIIIKLCVTDDTLSDQCRCRALVCNINGKEHQCTRKKKYGDFCGLHHDRKNKFKSIFNNSDTLLKKFNFSLLNLLTNIDNTNIYYKILYDYNIYYVNCISGDFYKKISNDELIKCNHLGNDIPYIII